MSAPSARRDRPRRRLFRRAFRAALRVVFWGALAALLAAVAFGSFTIRTLDASLRFARGSLGAALKTEDGVVFYADMDGRRPSDLVTGNPLFGTGSQSVP